MRSSKTMHVVSCHAEGEVGDVIVGGVAPPPGATLWEQSRFIAQRQTLRNFLLNEPRGGVFRHVNLLVPPKDPRAQMGFIIMEPEDTPPMSGSNSICVATVLLDSGILPMSEPRDAPDAGGAGRPDRGGRASAATARPSASPCATCPPSPTDWTRPRSRRPRHAQGRHRLWRRQFRHRRRPEARLRDPSRRGARSRRTRHEDHRGGERPARIFPSGKPGVGPHLVLPVRRPAEPRGRRADRPQRGCRAAGQDRPLADRHRLQRAHGGAARARAA